MIKTSTLTTSIQSKFEGGSSLTVDWDAVIAEGAQAMLQNCAPQRLNRETQIYAGVIGGIQMYYCPTDCAAPTGLFSNLNRLYYRYVAPNYFGEQVNCGSGDRIFTITYKNGARFILINAAQTVSHASIDEMDSVGTKTSDMVLAVNTYDFLTGSSSLMGTFTDTLKKISGTYTTPLDFSSYAFGTILIPFEVATARNVASAIFRFYTDPTNYITFTADISYLVDGWNYARLKVSDGVKFGVPNLASIASWEVDIPMTAGNSQTVIIDSISIQNTSLWLLGYTSNLIFVDSTTYERKVAPTDPDDLIDITDEEGQILLYECCRIVYQNATIASTKNIGEGNRFDGDLTRTYALYYSKNPSNEMPMSYNISPSISKHPPYGNDWIK